MTKTAAPLYIWSGDTQELDEAVASLGRGDIGIVTGPQSGPPRSSDDVTTLRRFVQSLHVKGVLVTGYIPWKYGQHSGDYMVSLARAWEGIGVDGLFVDETPSETTELLDDMRRINGMARGWRPDPRTGWLRGVSMWNPGTYSEDVKAAMTALPTSIWCTLEEACENFTLQAPRSSIPEREMYLVHTCDTLMHANTVDIITRQAFRRLGYVYVTPDGRDGNPWDSFRGK
jgi:hypothetical protein